MRRPRSLAWRRDGSPAVNANQNPAARISTPMPMYARAEMAQAADTKIVPGEQKLQVTLAVTFELQ